MRDGSALAIDEVRYREAEQRLWQWAGMAPTERRLELARSGATVRVQEAGEGPPVVFVHGASNGGASWATLVNRLDGFRCILLDRPGCCLSPPLGTRFDDVERLASFADALVVDVLDALGLDNAHLVGTSFGGYIALRSAAAHPDRIRRLLLFGWSVGAPIAVTPLVMRMGSIPLLGRLTGAVPPTRRMVKGMLRQIGLRGAVDSGRFTEEMVDWFLAMLRYTDTMANELRAGPRIITPLRGMNDSILLPASLLGSITVPTFFLWGGDDPMGGADTAHAFSALVPGAQLEVMPGAGHAPWIDDPDHAAAVTSAFLRS